jgi:hypothetical protein
LPAHATAPPDGSHNRRGVTHSTETIVHVLKLKTYNKDNLVSVSGHTKCADINNPYRNSNLWVSSKKEKTTIITKRSKIQAPNDHENLCASHQAPKLASIH